MLDPIASVTRSAALATTTANLGPAAAVPSTDDSGTFAASVLAARRAVGTSGSTIVMNPTASSAVQPDEQLLLAVRGRALAAGLRPSSATVHRTAVRDLERSAAATREAVSRPIDQTTASPTVTTPSATATGDAAPPNAGAAGLAPATIPDLGAPSTDTQTYLQQLFAFESDPSALATARASGTWPTEAMSDAARHQAIIQFVAAQVGAGPAYFTTTSLTNAQVLAAQDWSAQSPSLNLNPTYASALTRAARVAASAAGGGSSLLAWAGQDLSLRLIPQGSYGTTPVSGYYGTGVGAMPTENASPA